MTDVNPDNPYRSIETKVARSPDVGLAVSTVVDELLTLGVIKGVIDKATVSEMDGIKDPLVLVDMEEAGRKRLDTAIEKGIGLIADAVVLELDKSPDHLDQ